MELKIFLCYEKIIKTIIDSKWFIIKIKKLTQVQARTCAIKWKLLKKASRVYRIIENQYLAVKITWTMGISYRWQLDNPHITMWHWIALLYNVWIYHLWNHPSKGPTHRTHHRTLLCQTHTNHIACTSYLEALLVAGNKIMHQS